jgi:hypothetical protein
MLRYLIMVVSVSLSALGAVKFLHENPDALETAAVVAKDQIEVHKAKRTTSPKRKRPIRCTEPSGCAPILAGITSRKSC